MKALEYELKDKPKVDRGVLNSWFFEVQRTKVSQIDSFHRWVIRLFKDEAEKYRRRRDSTIDLEKQLRLALQEIEQVAKDTHFLQLILFE